jgi:hypothetical protein
MSRSARTAGNGASLLPAEPAIQPPFILGVLFLPQAGASSVSAAEPTNFLSV